MAALWAEFSEVETDRRRSARRTLRLIAQAADAYSVHDVLILDLSTTGLMLETVEPLLIDEIIQVELPHAGPIAARVLWRREAFFGCEFLSRAPVAAVSAALLRAAPEERDALASAASAPREVATEDRSAITHPKAEPASRGLALVALTLLLIAAVVFLLALMTLPFSAHQFAR